MRSRVGIKVIACIVSFVAVIWAEKLTLQKVIQEVIVNSDSVKMMKENIKKSDEMIRERWSAALPKVSASVTGARSYGSLMSGSSSGGGNSTANTFVGSGNLNGQKQEITFEENQDQNSISLQKQGKTTVLDSSEIFQIKTMSAEMMKEFSKPQARNVFSSSLSLQQPIYTFGKVGTAIKVANFFDSSTHASYNRGIQNLQLTAFDAFTGAIMTELALDIAKRSLDRKREVYEFLDRNFKLGSGSKASILLAQADYKGQYTQVIRSEQSVRTTQMLLNNLMGRELTQVLDLDTAIALQDLSSMQIPDENVAVEKGLKSRTDVRSLYYLSQANKGGAKIYNAMYLPTIAGFGSVGIGGDTIDHLVDWDKRNWMVGVTVQWSIFDGFANRAKANQYQSDARKLAIAQKAVEKMITIEIKSALTECYAADSERVASGEMLAAAKEGYELTKDNFLQGSGQLTDLQLAEERLLQAEMGSINARYNFIRSRAALKVAMGQNIINVEE